MPPGAFQPQRRSANRSSVGKGSNCLYLSSVPGYIIIITALLFRYIQISLRALLSACTASDWAACRCQIADVWSCGVMLFIMLAAAYPFGRPEDEQLKPSKKMHVMLQVIAALQAPLSHWRPRALLLFTYPVPSDGTPSMPLIRTLVPSE